MENIDSTQFSNGLSYKKSMLNRCIGAVKLFIIELTDSRKYVEHIISVSENQKKAIDILIDKSQIDYIGENPDLFDIIHHPYIADILIKEDKTGLLLDNLTLYDNLYFEHARDIIFLCMRQEYSKSSINNIIEKHITHFEKGAHLPIRNFLHTM